MSTLAWLAYSESERRSALDVIALFKECDTRAKLRITQRLGESELGTLEQAAAE
jgi:hypothetical protein